MCWTSRTSSDSSQLTIDSTIAAQIAVHQKSSMYRPQWVVFSVIQDGDPQHQRVDDDVDQAEGEDVERYRDELHDRFDDRVDETEDHGDDDDDPDPLQRGVTADEADARNDEGDHPQRETGEPGTQQKLAHGADLRIGGDRCHGRSRYVSMIQPWRSRASARIAAMCSPTSPTVPATSSSFGVPR